MSSARFGSDPEQDTHTEGFADFQSRTSPRFPREKQTRAMCRSFRAPSDWHHRRHAFVISERAHILARAKLMSVLG